MPLNPANTLLGRLVAVTCSGHLLRSRVSVCHCRALSRPTALRGERRRGRVWGKEAGFGAKRRAGFPSRDRSGRRILLSNPFPSQREAAPFLLSQGQRRLFAESRSRGLFSLSHAPSCPGLMPLGQSPGIRWSRGSDSLGPGTY